VLTAACYCESLSSAAVLTDSPTLMIIIIIIIIQQLIRCRNWRDSNSSILLSPICMVFTVFARNRDTAVPVKGNGDLQTDTDLCPCGETQMVSHIVESCPLTKLNGSLSRLQWFMTRFVLTDRHALF